MLVNVFLASSQLIIKRTALLVNTWAGHSSAGAVGMLCTLNMSSFKPKHANGTTEALGRVKNCITSGLPQLRNLQSPRIQADKS